MDGRLLLAQAGLRRRALLGAAAALAFAPQAARAQAYPAKPVRLVLGYPPGGGADITARAFVAPFGQALGQTLVIDNKSGAGGALAATEVARAAPDGHTLGLLDNAPMTIIPALRNPGYDPVAGFTPLGMVSQLPQVLVAHRDLPAGTPRELINLMRKSPGKLNHASGGPGSVSHLAAELFKARSNTFAVHVPFRGGAPAVTALIAGDVQFAFLTYATTGPFIRSGQLRALGVSSSARLPLLPSVPTIAEDALPGYEASGWFALLGPAGLPAAVVAALDKVLAETMAGPEVIARIEGLGQTVATGKVDARKAIAAELATWRKLISERRLVVDA